MHFYTIGYEGHSLQDFVGLLSNQGIDLVIDVREIPLSRRKGFSKSSLAQALEDAGMRYQSVRSLGSPRTIRQRYKLSHDWTVFQEEYLQRLREHPQVLTEVIEQAQQEKVCLLCFERDSSQCHRSLIAMEMQELSDHELVPLDL